MANRRMFSKVVTESDNFLDMGHGAQALYFHLGIQADDEGFVQPKRVMRMINAAEDDLKILAGKGFVIPFQSGVVVITHWKENNYIQSDRFSPTIWRSEVNTLNLSGNVYKLDTERIQNVSQEGRVVKGVEGNGYGEFKKIGSKLKKSSIK